MADRSEQRRLGADRSEAAGSELVHGVEAGVVSREFVIQLGDVLAGTATGRRADDDITIFDSTGLAIQDLAVALAAMEKADELDLPTLGL